jgi:hypothetical protein
MSLTGAKWRIEEDRAAAHREADLAHRLRNDKEVHHAIEELTWRIRARILEVISKEEESSPGQGAKHLHHPQRSGPP